MSTPSLNTDTPDRLHGPWMFLAPHSSIGFSLPYVVVDFRGRFTEVSAELADGVLSGAARVESLDVEHEVLRPHMLGPEFFDADRFPELSFRSTSLTISGDDIALEGEMTLKGVTRPVTCTGHVAGPRQDSMNYIRLGLALRAEIDRTEFGIDWNADLPEGGRALSDTVVIEALIEFARPAE